MAFYAVSGGGGVRQRCLKGCTKRERLHRKVNQIGLRLSAKFWRNGVLRYSDSAGVSVLHSQTSANCFDWLWFASYFLLYALVRPQQQLPPPLLSSNVGKQPSCDFPIWNWLMDLSQTGFGLKLILFAVKQPHSCPEPTGACPSPGTNGIPLFRVSSFGTLRRYCGGVIAFYFNTSPGGEIGGCVCVCVCVPVCPQPAPAINSAVMAGFMGTSCATSLRLF